MTDEWDKAVVGANEVCLLSFKPHSIKMPVRPFQVNLLLIAPKDWTLAWVMALAEYIFRRATA